MEQERVEWIDIYKSIAIILVILGHTSGVFNRYIYLFHVPIFFLIAGYTEKFEEESLFKVICKKFCSLLIPFYCINIFTLIWRLYLNFINLDLVFYSDSITLEYFKIFIKEILKTSWATDLGGASWFLLALFVGIFISKVFLLLERISIYISLILSFIAFGFVHILWTNNIHIPLKIDYGLLVSFYIILGRYLKIYKVENRVKFNNKYLFAVFILLYFGIFSNILEAYTDISNYNINTAVVDLLSVVFGYILMINICNIGKYFKRVEKLLYIGRNTLPLMLLHFIILKIIYIVEYYLGIGNINEIKNLTPASNRYCCFIYTLVVIEIFILINKYFERKKWYQICFMGKLYKFLSER